jgi:hypothetical protein
MEARLVSPGKRATGEGDALRLGLAALLAGLVQGPKLRDALVLADEAGFGG